ncbi:hypothetical protein ABEF95_015660 [Exophiala dermatitidis]
MEGRSWRSRTSKKTPEVMLNMNTPTSEVALDVMRIASKPVRIVKELDEIDEENGEWEARTDDEGENIGDPVEVDHELDRLIDELLDDQSDEEDWSDEEEEGQDERGDVEVQLVELMAAVAVEETRLDSARDRPEPLRLKSRGELRIPTAAGNRYEVVPRAFPYVRDEIERGGVVTDGGLSRAGDEASDGVERELEAMARGERMVPRYADDRSTEIRCYNVNVTRELKLNERLDDEFGS